MLKGMASKDLTSIEIWGERADFLALHGLLERLAPLDDDSSNPVLEAGGDVAIGALSMDMWRAAHGGRELRAAPRPETPGLPAWGVRLRWLTTLVQVWLVREAAKATPGLTPAEDALVSRLEATVAEGLADAGADAHRIGRVLARMKVGEIDFLLTTAEGKGYELEALPRSAIPDRMYDLLWHVVILHGSLIEQRAQPRRPARDTSSRAPARARRGTTRGAAGATAAR